MFGLGKGSTVLKAIFVACTLFVVFSVLEAVFLETTYGLDIIRTVISTVFQPILSIFGIEIPWLSPARDWTGTWISGIQGEGLVLWGINGPHKFHYDIRLELTQNGNTLSGTMWSTMWKVDVLDPRYPWTEPLPGPTQVLEMTNGTASGTTIQFKAGFLEWKTSPGATTDIMSGTVYGYSEGVTYEGEFHLRREWH